MKLTDEAFFRFVGHDLVWQVWLDGGLTEDGGQIAARHGVAVAAGCWAAALFSGIKENDVVHAVYGALLHDASSRFEGEAPDRSSGGDGGAGAAHILQTTSQSAFLKRYGWRDGVIACARPVNHEFLSEVDIEVDPRDRYLIIRAKRGLPLARQVILLAHYVMGNESSPGLPSWSVGSWVIPRLAPGMVPDDNAVLPVLLNDAPRLYRLSLERYKALGTDPISN